MPAAACHCLSQIESAAVMGETATAMKGPAMHERALLVSIAVLLGAPAPCLAAGFLSTCLRGCEAKASGLRADQPIGKLWIGPSIGFDVFTRYAPTKEYRTGVIPGVGYGVKWRPSGWKVTTNALALDLFLQANLVKATTDGGFDHFDIDVLPVFTVIDWISVGFGYRRQLAVSSGSDRGGALFSIGIRKSTASF